MEYLNLADMFFSKRQNFSDRAAYLYKENGQWLTVTYGQAIEKAEKIAAGFASLGIEQGDRIAIISGNRLEWALSDYAALSLGAALVPVYPSLPEDQVEYILNDSAVKIVIAEDSNQLEKVTKIFSNLKTVKHFYVIDCKDKELKSPWLCFSSLAETGKTFLEKNADYIYNSIKSIDRKEPATVIYTSGTTGEPKGVVLTHGNFLSNLKSASQIFGCYPEDIFLSFLPLSHVLERTASHYFSVYSGASLAYAESIESISENMQEIRPTLMVSVPRLYEKMYAKIIENVEAGPTVKRKIFYRAIAVGKLFQKNVKGNLKISALLKAKRNLAYKLVFIKIQQKLGGRLRFFVSGGAPLSPEIGEFMDAAGVIILEGYGLTETSPGITFNTPEAYKFGTVGKPIPDVEVKIAEDGEILTRGPHVMAGYLNKEADTREVIDEDGWFYTGDIGFFDDEGFLKITDRKKNIIVTSGGKNIAPQPIENKLMESPLIEQAVVIGDKRKFCSAVIVPQKEALINRAQKEQLDISNYELLCKDAKIKDWIQGEIDRQTVHFAGYERVKKFILVTEPFTQENGELTPTLKIKRKVVEEKYMALIDALYDVESAF